MLRLLFQITPRQRCQFGGGFSSCVVLYGIGECLRSVWERFWKREREREIVFERQRELEMSGLSTQTNGKHLYIHAILDSLTKWSGHDNKFFSPQNKIRSKLICTIKKGNSHKNCGFVLCTQFGSNYNSPHWRCLAGSDVLVILIFYLSKWNIRGTTKTNQQNTISGDITINFKHTHKLTSAHANFHI